MKMVLSYNSNRLLLVKKMVYYLFNRHGARVFFSLNLARQPPSYKDIGCIGYSVPCTLKLWKVLLLNNSIAMKIGSCAQQSETKRLVIMPDTSCNLSPAATSSTENDLTPTFPTSFQTLCVNIKCCNSSRTC